MEVGVLRRIVYCLVCCEILKCKLEQINNFGWGCPLTFTRFPLPGAWDRLRNFIIAHPGPSI